MSNDLMIVGFIAIIEAVIIGLLLSDKLGLIKSKKIHDNSNDDKGIVPPNPKQEKLEIDKGG